MITGMIEAFYICCEIDKSFLFSFKMFYVRFFQSADIIRRYLLSFSRCLFCQPLIERMKMAESVIFSQTDHKTNVWLNS